MYSPHLHQLRYHTDDLQWHDARHTLVDGVRLGPADQWQGARGRGSVPYRAVGQPRKAMTGTQPARPRNSRPLEPLRAAPHPHRAAVRTVPTRMCHVIMSYAPCIGLIVTAVVTTDTVVARIMTPYSLVRGYQRFGRTCCLCLHSAIMNLIRFHVQYKSK
jgi:hypothetical protein